MVDSHQRGRGPKEPERQLVLPLRPGLERPAENPPRPISAPAQRAFRVIRGEGKRRDEKLRSRDDVVRLLVAAAADMMLKRITPERAHEIQVRVERVQRLFERCERDPVLWPLLRVELETLEKVWRETEHQRPLRGRP
jgi:hypothetical protein